MVAMNQCGRGFCPVPARLFWNEPGLTIKQAAAMCGITSSSLHRHAEWLGLGERWRKKNKLHIPLRALKQAWLDEKTPLPAHAKRLGIYMRYFQQIAVSNGWPPRKYGRKAEYAWPDDFNDMWFAGVSLRELAAAAGSDHHKTAANEVRRRGLGPRDKGRRRSLPMREYLILAAQRKYAADLAKAAATEREAAKTHLKLFEDAA